MPFNSHNILSPFRFLQADTRTFNNNLGFRQSTFERFLILGLSLMQHEMYSSAFTLKLNVRVTKKEITYTHKVWAQMYWKSVCGCSYVSIIAKIRGSVDAFNFYTSMEIHTWKSNFWTNQINHKPCVLIGGFSYAFHWIAEFYRSTFYDCLIANENRLIVQMKKLHRQIELGHWRNDWTNFHVRVV